MSAEQVLREAAQLARREYSTVRGLHRSIKRDFSCFEKSMNGMCSSLLDFGPKHESLGVALMDILEVRRKGVKVCWEEWSALFAQRQKDLDFFTVMLFGRTMAGKSTTLEALAGGDRSRIGDGTPDFTTKIDEVRDGKLRIVDTPGIEGFSAETAGQAEAYMDRADVVVFVVSDDHIEPALLERIVSILNRHKPLIILLNVKAGNLERARRCPGRLFREEELAGHRQRIRGHLRESFDAAKIFMDVDSVPIIEYCAEAANLARNDKGLDEEVREELHRLSRIDHFVDCLFDLITTKGIGIRVLAAHESFMRNQEEIEDGLRVELSRVSKEQRVLSQSIAESDRLFDDICQRGKQQVTGLAEHFHFVEQKIDPFVDGAFANAFGDPEAEFRRILDLGAVKKRAGEFCESFRQDVTKQIEEFQRRTNMDISVASEMALDEMSLDVSFDCDNVRSGELRISTGKWTKIAGVPVLGFAAGRGAASLAAAFGVSGWLSVAIGVLAGGLTSMATGAIGEAIQEGGKDDLAKAKRELRGKLRRQVGQIRDVAVVGKMNSWVETAVQDSHADVKERLEIVHQEIAEFHRTGRFFVQKLEDIRAQGALASMTAILPLVLPMEICEKITLSAVTRRIAYHTKVAVVGRNGESVAGLLIGKGGATVERFRELLSGERITIVSTENGELTEKSVRQALRPANLEDACVRISREGGTSLPRVDVSGLSDRDARIAAGRHKWNLRLAETLLGCRISLNGGWTKDER